MGAEPDPLDRSTELNWITWLPSDVLSFTGRGHGPAVQGSISTSQARGHTAIALRAEVHPGSSKAVVNMSQRTLRIPSYDTGLFQFTVYNLYNILESVVFSFFLF